MSAVPDKGFLRDYPLSNILGQMSRERSTGVLKTTTQGIKREIYLEKGSVSFASSGAPEERLGEMLYREGVLTAEQYDAVVRELKLTGLKQGEILVEQELLTPGGLFEALRRQATRIANSLFEARDGLFEFRQGERPPIGSPNLRLGVAHLVCDGIRRITDRVRIRNEMPDVNNILMLSPDPRGLFHGIELREFEKRALMMVDGDRTIGEILDASGGDAESIRHALYVLWSMGTLTEQFNLQVPELTVEEILMPVDDRRGEFLARVDAVHGALGGMDEYKLLSVERTSDFEEISARYYRLSKEFHQERYPDLDEDTRRKLADITDAIESAYSILRRRQLERTYTEGDEDLAHALMKVAEEEMKGERYREAVRFLEEAVSADPDNAACWHDLSLAARRLSGSKPRAHEAAGYALGLDPDNVDYHLSMGQLLLDMGRAPEAREVFRQAYEIDPEDRRARDAVMWFKASDSREEA